MEHLENLMFPYEHDPKFMFEDMNYKTRHNIMVMQSHDPVLRGIIAWANFGAQWQPFFHEDPEMSGYWASWGNTLSNLIERADIGLSKDKLRLFIHETFSKYNIDRVQLNGDDVEPIKWLAEELKELVCHAELSKKFNSQFDYEHQAKILYQSMSGDLIEHNRNEDRAEILKNFENKFGNMAIDAVHTYRLLDYILDNYDLKKK